jgi:uncharacterized protein (DUF2252 family)
VRSSSDPIELIVEVNLGRSPVLLRRKFEAMARDPFAFLRGTAMLGHRAADLAALPASPLGWVCGDLHLQNFGCFRGANRLVYFDLNDFDEAARLPVALDLLRLVGSIVTAGGTLGLERRVVRKAVTGTVDGYARALERGKAFWLERETADGPIRTLLHQVQQRKRRSLLASRTRLQGGRRVIAVDGARYLELAKRSPVRTQIPPVLEWIASRHPDPRFFEPRDVAIRIAGMGSLGVARYVALVRGKGDPDRNALVDFKFAAPSSAAQAFARHRQPEWPSEAARVVAVQDLCQAASPAFLSSVMLGKAAFIARELQPVEDRVTLPRLARRIAGLDATLRAMGELAAYAQLRSAGRLGAAPVEDLVGYGAQLRTRPGPWIDAAFAIASANQKAFARFADAWLGGDERLLAPCR